MIGRRSRASRIAELRRAIDTLPERTRAAMLAGIRDEDIIVGAYSDRAGGVCPMLAAHRRGGRTTSTFAAAWDAFARARRARRASRHELRILESHLQASLAAEIDGALETAVAAHQALGRDRRAREAGLTGRAWLEPAASGLVQADELVRS